MESLFSYARNLSPIGVRATAAPAAADDDPLKEVSYLRGSVAALTETVAEMRDELSQLRDDGEAARNEISQLRELVRRGPDGALVLAEGEADDDSFRPYSPFQVRPPRVDTAAAAPSPGQIRRSRGIEISTPTTEEKPRARARTASGDAKPVMSPLAMSSSSAPPPPPPPPPRRSGARLLVAGACLLVLAYAAGAYTPPLWLAPAPPPPPLEAAPVAVPWAVRLDRLGRGARAAVADAGVRLGGGARAGRLRPLWAHASGRRRLPPRRRARGGSICQVRRWPLGAPPRSGSRGPRGRRPPWWRPPPSSPPPRSPPPTPA